MIFLVKIFGNDIDPAIFVFIAGGSLAALWWISKQVLKLLVYNKIDSKFTDVNKKIDSKFETVMLEIIKNRDVNVAEIKAKREESRHEHQQSRQAIELQMRTTELEHKKDIMGISQALNNHAQEDTKTFNSLLTSIGNIEKNVSNISQLTDLIKDGKLNIPRAE